MNCIVTLFSNFKCVAKSFTWLAESPRMIFKVVTRHMMFNLDFQLDYIGKLDTSGCIRGSKVIN